MNTEFGDSRIMGPKLRAEVERQLLKDLQIYRPDLEDVIFDWSETCQEGPVTNYLDGSLENWSGVAVKDANGNLIAYGWIDFIDGGVKEPLLVFWDLLTIRFNNKNIDVKKEFGIPKHIWNKVSAESK
jgi:hypothetical protein